MFSEYASRLLSKSQRHPAPLFEASISEDDSGHEAFLGWAQESSSSHNSDEGEPPPDIAIEQPPNTHNSSDSRYPVWSSSTGWGTNVASSALDQPGPPEYVQAHTTIDTNNTHHHHNTHNTTLHNNNAHHHTNHPHNNPRNAYNAHHSQRKLHFEQILTLGYAVLLATTFASAVMVYFSTDSGSTVGVYPVLARSARFLQVYALLACVVAGLYVYFMQTNPRLLVQLCIVAVPIVSGCVGLYAVVMSFHGAASHTAVHLALRLAALAPLCYSLLWVLSLRRNKQLVGQATQVVAYAGKFVHENPFVVWVTLGCGAVALFISCMWAVFLARALLDGSVGILFAAIFTFTWLWTWGVVCELQTCAIVAAVNASYWSHASPPVSATESSARAPDLAIDAIRNSVGAVILSALLRLVFRLPRLLLPRHIIRAADLALGLLPPGSVPVQVPLTGSLVLPVAVAGRMPLVRAAQILSTPRLAGLDKRAYSAACRILFAARPTCSLFVGLVAWVHADREGSAASVYGYLVAFVAFGITWTVIATGENTFRLVIDGLLVSYALDEHEAGNSLQMHRLFCGAFGEAEVQPEAEFV